MKDNERKKRKEKEKRKIFFFLRKKGKRQNDKRRRMHFPLGVMATTQDTGVFIILHLQQQHYHSVTQ